MAKKKAAAHHGGAWKVAYADFVTAMMALFMVLWISAQDNKILIATSQYFQNPFRSPMEATSGVLPFNSNKSTHSEGKEVGDAKEQSNNKQIQLSFLNSVASDFYRLLHLDENLEDKPIDIQVTSDGLRINLFDRARRPLFKNDSAEFTEWGKFMMQNLAWMVDRHHFRVTIDGHTKTPEVAPKSDDAAWELSAARANSSRHLLVYYAVDPGLIERVTGYADTKPLPNELPTSESNQRVTLMLTLESKKDQEKDAAPTAPAATAEGSTAPSPSTPISSKS
jgi:chemotaxis protein MotB